ncbi:lysophospholipase D GDPD1-like [Dendronephthya gigantea]|uniref:lysophospholipase D GDPD1-like n=1 Tax=Dendronephthya gigantea TaxID=151771 RepID=UPI00106C4A70|nr:lysophospholipase D GDPD1-like [Dendronephthya gigantea]
MFAMFIPIFGGYFCISWFFLRFPNLLHRKKERKFTCKHISHRGGAGENIENTMTAYHHAVHSGTEMLELDVHLTADGQVVVTHDNDLGRICGVRKKICETNYEDLPSLLPVLDVTFQPGKKAVGKNTSEKIPLLESVFKAFPEHPINVDIKDNNDELIDKVHQLIVDYNRKDKTVWGTFSDEVNSKLYKKDPEISLLFGIWRCVSLVAMYYLGILPFVPLKEGFLEILLPSTLLKRDLTNNQRMIVRIVDWFIMNPSLIKHLERRGIQTYLWVLNEDEEFTRAFEHLGATGVMTDYPSKLTDYLERTTNDKNN